VKLAGNESPGSVRLASAAGRWVLAVAVLGDSLILLEATVVNVALPTIGRDLGAGVAGLQWTLNSYVLTLAALVLVGGSLSDSITPHDDHPQYSPLRSEDELPVSSARPEPLNLGGPRRGLSGLPVKKRQALRASMAFFDCQQSRSRQKSCRIYVPLFSLF
jgi:MFS family permease